MVGTGDWSRMVTLPPSVKRTIGALSLIAHAMMNAPETMDELATTVAPEANLDVTLKMGALVASSPLDDEAEPAPVFEA